MEKQYNELKYLTFARFIFKARATSPLQLPTYKGSTFRGGFGHSLKKTVCINPNRSCDSCILQSRCIYIYIFETKPPEDSKVERFFNEVPHPFVINPPETEQKLFEVGEEFSFELILFGKAIDYLPFFLFVFMQLGELGIGKGKGSYLIDSVQNERFNELIEIYSNQTKRLSNLVQIYSSENFSSIYNKILTQNPPRITIQFLTPFRFKMSGKLQNDFTFFDFFKILLNRFYLLTYFHCGNKFDRDHRELLELCKAVEIKEKNLHWQDWIRFSNRQMTSMKMGGLLGELSLQGKLNPFLPFLKIGEFTNLGKSTSMGLGKYKIITNE